jgi:hypothetical protein
MPAVDKNIGNAYRGAPANDAVAITPNNSIELANVVDSIFVGVAGTVNLVPLNGSVASPVSFTAVAGSVIPVRTRQVLSSGTSATGLVGLLY